MSALPEELVDAAGGRRTRRRVTAYAVATLALIVATIAGVFAFQAAGYPPCELCLKERLPFYVGMALAALSIPVAARGDVWSARLCFGLLALLFLASAALGAYHAGVEWGFWPGPTDCTGTPERAGDSAAFLQQLRTTRVVRCDAVAIRVLGLSLAGWNTVVSLAIAALAAAGFARTRRT